MSGGQTIDVVVTAVAEVTPLIRHFTLVQVGGSPLPAFSGGSHIIVVMRGENRVHRNPYSLLSAPQDLATYEIAVRRMEESRGGSHFMHDQVKVGSHLEIAHPVNLFALDKIARKHLMIAGGIGITPFMAQLEDLRSGSVPFELHYSVRAPEHAAFRDRLESRAAGHVQFYYDSEKQVIDFNTLLSSQPLGTHVYVCGPAGFIGRVIDTAKACGWSGSHIHWEQFSAPPAGDAFEVTLRKSGKTITVATDNTLLEAIEAAGVEVPYLCRGGVCGFCQTAVVECDGELLHYDHYLSDADKAKGRTIMPCVSRARAGHFVLDL